MQSQLNRECSATKLLKGIPQQLSGSCGTLMILNLGMILGLVDPNAAPVLESHHHNLQQLARARGLHFGLQGFGLQPSEAQVLLRLSQLLVEKGVPAARAEERARMGFKKVGITEIQQALDNVNPWAYLKAITSRPHLSFHWLKADELQSKVRSKANAKFAIQPSEKRKKRPQRSVPEEPLQIDAAQLQLVPQTFFAPFLHAGTRLAFFRDQFPDDWMRFVEQPVRMLLQRVPLLSLCKQNGCGVSCGRYHADIDEPSDNLIMDLWSRGLAHTLIRVPA